MLRLVWIRKREAGQLAPDFKTIADFRKNNGAGIRNACRQFVILCREIGLFANAVVAIDGCKFRAVNAHNRNFTRGKVAKRLAQIDQCIDRYMGELDTADRQEPDIAEARTTRLNEKIKTMKAQMEKCSR